MILEYLNLINPKLILDSIPVFLAVFALSKLYKIKHNSLIIVLSKSSAILLIICQLSWIHAYLHRFTLVTSFFDNIWSVFNSIVMLMILAVADRESKSHVDRDCTKCSSFEKKKQLLKIVECSDGCERFSK